MLNSHRAAIRIVVFVMVLGIIENYPPTNLGGQNLTSAALDDLAWMSGYWVGEKNGVKMEECWLKPSGGVMLGVHRDVPKSGRSFFEYLRIETTAEGIVYLASPMGRAATPFRMNLSSKNQVVFENLEHDFPQRIIYRLDEAGALLARVEGEENGQMKADEWVWTRANLTLGQN